MKKRKEEIIENLAKNWIYFISQRVGQGLPLWLPKGAALRDRLEQFLKKHKKAGYEQVVTHI